MLHIGYLLSNYSNYNKYANIQKRMWRFDRTSLEFKTLKTCSLHMAGCGIRMCVMCMHIRSVRVHACAASSHTFPVRPQQQYYSNSNRLRSILVQNTCTAVGFPARPHSLRHDMTCVTTCVATCEVFSARIFG